MQKSNILTVMQNLNNPFTSSSPLNTSLTIDECQEIRLKAIQELVSHKETVTVIPDTLGFEQLQHHIPELGLEIFLAHPTYIERVFNGVSTDIFQAIQGLYCDYIGRSVDMIFLILKRMAENVGASSISYEAIWCICLYLDRLHQKRFVVRREVVDDIWHLYQVRLAVNALDKFGEIYEPHCLLVISERNIQVVGLSLDNRNNMQQASLMALYQALSLQRKPASLETAGIIWQTPNSIRVPYPLSPALNMACQVAGLETQEDGSDGPSGVQALLNRIIAYWEQPPLLEQTVNETQLTRLFNTYLYKSLGYSPLRAERKWNHTWRHLFGYNRDPASLLPPLRMFIPEHSAFTHDDGSIMWNGLRYENPLLAYWPNIPITIRISPHAESRCWVYLDGDVLCDAYLREMKGQNEPDQRDQLYW